MKPSNAQKIFETDEFQTKKGPLKITFIGHGSLMMEWDNKVIHIDPYLKLADYSLLPKADVILITHEHQDHFDEEAINQVKKDNTEFVFTTKCAANAKSSYAGTAIANGGIRSMLGMTIEAVPAYNIVNKRKDGNPFHPKGEGNGYVLNFANIRVYIAGDTENIHEMKNLKNIDIAFLPMNLPYTMTPEMVAEAARSFNPKILYPYHFGDTNTSILLNLMKDTKTIEIRIRDMK